MSKHESSSGTDELYRPPWSQYMYTTPCHKSDAGYRPNKQTLRLPYWMTEVFRPLIIASTAFLATEEEERCTRHRHCYKLKSIRVFPKPSTGQNSFRHGWRLGVQAAGRRGPMQCRHRLPGWSVLRFPVTARFIAPIFPLAGSCACPAK